MFEWSGIISVFKTSIEYSFVFFELFMIPAHVHRFGGMEPKLYSITTLRLVLYRKILSRVDNVFYDILWTLKLSFYN